MEPEIFQILRRCFLDDPALLSFIDNVHNGGGDAQDEASIASLLVVQNVLCDLADASSYLAANGGSLQQTLAGCEGQAAVRAALAEVIRQMQRDSKQKQAARAAAHPST